MMVLLQLDIVDGQNALTCYFALYIRPKPPSKVNDTSILSYPLLSLCHLATLISFLHFDRNLFAVLLK